MSFYDLGPLRVQFLTELCTPNIECSNASPECFRAVKWRSRTVCFVINLNIDPFLFHFSAPISPPHPIPACWGEGHDSGSHIPHPAPPLLPWDISFQYYDVGPIGTTKHPQTLEPELSATRTPFKTLCSPLLQGSEEQCFYVLKTYLCFFLNELIILII